MPNRWTSQAFAGALALAGAAAVVGGVAVGFRSVFGDGEAWGAALGLVALGVGVQVAAVVLSVVGARGRGRPIVAMVYGGLALGVVGLYVLAQVQTHLHYRANPGTASLNPTEDGTGVEVESIVGRRRVRYDRCPGGDPDALSTGFDAQDGYLDVSRGSGRPYMRIYTEQAAEACLVDGSPVGADPLPGTPFRDGIPMGNRP